MVSKSAATANTPEMGASPKRSYQRPTLVRYGAVRDLTHGGATSNSETPGNCSDTKKSTPCPTAPSDRRVKQNIERVGTHPLGIGLYLFDYKAEYQAEFGRGRQFGVMADEVEQVLPEAVVVHPRGCKAVDYAKLGVVRFH
jgi:hypothetical protein